MPQTTHSRKSYEQFCPMATALDFVGDRWTILILRELLGGPARFQDLKDGLPGIATNLLSERLRRMESDAIVRRVDGNALYALTETGEGVRTAIEELGMWGARMARTVGPVTPPVHERSTRAIAMALQSILVRSPYLPAETETIELLIDGAPVEVVLGPKPAVTVRVASRPDARATASADDMATFLAGTRTGADTINHDAGDSGTTQLLIDLLGG
ncbi:MAG: helix-turn-helix transcriptional regulator [Acidimicrobiia bacterium]|nr:helix-turn-helix transcriptional regulator [Acidimicrobiia bacterium]